MLMMNVSKKDGWRAISQDQMHLRRCLLKGNNKYRLRKITSSYWKTWSIITSECHLTARDLSKNVLLPYNQYLRRFSWSCENDLHSPYLFPFTISNFGSDLTPRQITFRCNTRLSLSRTSHDLSQYAVFVAIRSIASKIQLILWKRPPSILNEVPCWC